MLQLLERAREGLDEEYAPDGYNIGINDGSAAGQTVFHLHMHLIPRYHGDARDPRGGVRHVLPEKARDMLEVRSEPEAELRGRVTSVDLTRHALALLDEGRRSATYKPALLLAIVELATERVSGADPVRLPLSDIAERVMELYWQQTRPHPDSAIGVLRQATGSRSRIISALLRLRQAVPGTSGTSLGQVRLRAPEAYQRCRREVARALAMQPIPRLQRPGAGPAGGAYPRFLYDDGDFRSERGWVGQADEAFITLKPGVAQALAAGATVLRLAVEDVWTREVAAINRLQTEEGLLRSFLFGVDRTQLGAVAEALRDAGQRSCFWCDGPLRQTQVDHVIPWSHYPNDDLFNLVLADRACNSDKRASLVSADRIRQWAQRDQEMLSDVSERLRWPMDSHRAVRVALSAYRFLPQGVPLWAGVRRLELFDERQRDDIERHLTGFLRSAG